MASNCSRMIDVDKLAFADNIRTPECEAIPAMVESYRRAGCFKVNHPLVVSEKAGDEGQTFLVLVGNRRGKGLVWLRDEDKPAYDRILPGGKVPALVHKGLTREEEAELRIDHSADEDRVPLDDFSTYLAIKQLVVLGIDTQEHIAKKLGLFKTSGKNAGQPRREYVQQRTNLVRLPQFVEDEVRKLTLDKDSTRIRWNQIPTLYKLFNKEYVKHGSDGPEFRAYWNSILAPPEAIDAAEGDTTEPKELSPAEAVKRSQSASSDGLKQALLVVTRQSDSDLAAIDARLVAAESALRVLEDVKVYLGEKDFSELVATAIAQGNDRRQAIAEEANAEEEVTTA